jgi:hypothetical protein
MATAAMVEMATAMETAIVAATATETVTAMMPPLPPTATMSMKTTAVIQGWQLDNSNWMIAIGQ